MASTSSYREPRFPDGPELECFTICSLHRIRSFCNVLCANGGVVVDHSSTNMGGAPRAYTMTAQSVHIRRVISRSHAILCECLILIELSRAIACCRIAEVKKSGDEKLPYLIITERTSAKYLSLHSRRKIAKSKYIPKMMALLEEALGGTAIILRTQQVRVTFTEQPFESRALPLKAHEHQ